jgi:hypothetical protein
MKQLSNYGIVLLFGALLLSPLSIWAQEQVSGTVTDENGAPLPETGIRKLHLISLLQVGLLQRVVQLQLLVQSS